MTSVRVLRHPATCQLHLSNRGMRFQPPKAWLDAFHGGHPGYLGSRHSWIGDTKSTEYLLDNACIRTLMGVCLTLSIAKLSG